MSRLIAALSLLFLSMSSRLIADDKVDYLKLIKPLLKHKCVSCHGPLRRKGGLRLDAVALMKKGGDSGTSLVAGKPDKSLLVGVLTGKDGYTRMPKDEKPLKPAEIALIKRWIAQGAVAPKNEPVEKSPSEHWAYQVPKRPAVPHVKNSKWVRNPIDAFIAAEHGNRGLKPQPPAKNHILLRRVYLDLTGLPPTPQQLRAFLNDKSPRAYEKVVDQLLNSPRYGERWGRHWMDVWRYSDWYGYRAQLRNSARHIWRWRDYIVESLNNDTPYDRMIVDMLAADENSPTDRNRLRATGYLARHYYIFNRDKWLDEAIEHTGKAFLGLTINCAKCHEHKYDPIEQRDYYEFRALFEPYQVRSDRVPGQSDVNKDGLALAYDAKHDTKTYIYERGNDKYPIKDDPVAPEVPDFFAGKRFKIRSVKLPPELWYPGMRPYVRKELLAKAEAAIRAKRAALAKAEQQLAMARKRVPAGISRKPVVASRPISRRDVKAVAPFLVDGFDKKNANVWEYGDGTWKYAGKSLTQTRVAKSRQIIRTKKSHPRDFDATFRFRTTGGGVFKSVGISFDDDGKGRSDGVYLSAFANGPKVQYTRQRGGNAEYPRGAAKPMPVKIGAKQELRIAVRDRLLNVWVNGVLRIVHTLSDSRQPGKLTLWTFDATADFLGIEARPLAATVKLAGRATAQRTKKQFRDPASAVKLAQGMHKAAKFELAEAEASLKSLRARITADGARYSPSASHKAKPLIAAAIQAEKIAQLRNTEAALARAESDFVKSGGAKLAAKRQAARKALAAARKAMKTKSADYAPLTKKYPSTSTGRRLALAKWIASERNPLTARVAVNHIWMRHFGQPLVPTVFDFGLNGKPPTHPQLLDWLAVEFMRPTKPAGRTRRGWSMKHLHRLIVTSNAYRMSSGSRDAAKTNLQADKDNVYLWRMNPRRMESEAVRDSVLFVAGKLDLKIGGPELDSKLGQSTFRRSIYYRHAPEKFMRFLQVFDGAKTTECYRRSETVVPQQSLAMINSRLVIEQSRRLTALLNKQAKTDDEFVERLFVRLLCRQPTTSERITCLAFLRSQTARLKQSKKLSTFTGGTKLSVPPSNDPATRARENLAQVMLNHNEFVTIR